MFEQVCNNNHYHLPIEGSSPLIGNRAAAAGSYNADMCREWAQIMNTFMLTEYWQPPKKHTRQNMMQYNRQNSNWHYSHNRQW